MKTDHFRDLHTNTGTKLKGMINTECKDMAWIPPDDRRLQWRAYMNVAMNLHVLLCRDVPDQLSNNFFTEDLHHHISK